MISERLRDTYVMWSDPNSPYCDGTPHGAEVVLDAADLIDALVAALEKAKPYVAAYESEHMSNVALEVLLNADAALARAGRK